MSKGNKTEKEIEEELKKEAKKHFVIIECTNCGATDKVSATEWSIHKKDQEEFDDLNLVCNICEAINSFEEKEAERE